jgi:lactoylglutathione lyase
LEIFQTVQDVKRSAEFYLRIFGKVIRSSEPTIIQIANSWLVLNVGGGPTDDKPSITLHTPQNQNEASNFMNIRVADIWACYDEWQSRGAEFITEPKDHGVEIRCFAILSALLLSVNSLPLAVDSIPFTEIFNVGSASRFLYQLVSEP